MLLIGGRATKEPTDESRLTFAVQTIRHWLILLRVTSQRAGGLDPTLSLTMIEEAT